MDEETHLHAPPITITGGGCLVGVHHLRRDTTPLSFASFAQRLSTNKPNVCLLQPYHTCMSLNSGGGLFVALQREKRCPDGGNTRRRSADILKPTGEAQKRAPFPPFVDHRQKDPGFLNSLLAVCGACSNHTAWGGGFFFICGTICDTERDAKTGKASILMYDLFSFPCVSHVE